MAGHRLSVKNSDNTIKRFSPVTYIASYEGKQLSK